MESDVRSVQSRVVPSLFFRFLSFEASVLEGPDLSRDVPPRRTSRNIPFLVAFSLFLTHYIF